jgi:hypothetical protein
VVRVSAHSRARQPDHEVSSVDPRDLRRIVGLRRPPFVRQLGACRDHPAPAGVPLVESRARSPLIKPPFQLTPRHVTERMAAARLPGRRVAAPGAAWWTRGTRLADDGDGAGEEIAEGDTDVEGRGRSRRRGSGRRRLPRGRRRSRGAGRGRAGLTLATAFWPSASALSGHALHPARLPRHPGRPARGSARGTAGSSR